jgi:hypothetical protein
LNKKKNSKLIFNVYNKLKTQFPFVHVILSVQLIFLECGGKQIGEKTRNEMKTTDNFSFAISYSCGIEFSLVSEKNIGVKHARKYFYVRKTC